MLQFKAGAPGANQQITLYGPAPARAGTRTTIVASARTGDIPYGQRADLGNGILAFAGPREDPFYFDLTQFFRIQPDRNFANQPNPPANSARCFRTDGKDFSPATTCSRSSSSCRARCSRAADVPGRINVWATTSLKEGDPDAPPQSAAASLANVVRDINTRFGGATDSARNVDAGRASRPSRGQRGHGSVREPRRDEPRGTHRRRRAREVDPRVHDPHGGPRRPSPTPR